MTAFDLEAYLAWVAKLIFQHTEVLYASDGSRSRQLILSFQIVPEKPASLESSKADACQPFAAPTAYDEGQSHVQWHRRTWLRGWKMQKPSTEIDRIVVEQFANTAKVQSEKAQRCSYSAEAIPSMLVVVCHLRHRLAMQTLAICIVK